MKNRRNYYRILQVQPDAPVEIIRAGYRTLMLALKQHPDLGGSAADASVLNEAYEVLSDPVRRADYDKQFFARYPKQSRSQNKPPRTTVLCPVCKKPQETKPQPGERCATCQSPLQSDTPMENKRSCQRAISRTKKEERITYRTSWPGKSQRGMMLDFSPKGLRFLCFEQLPAGSILRISCRHFEASAVITNIHRQVVDGVTLYAAGASFLAVIFTEPKGALLSTSA